MTGIKRILIAVAVEYDDGTIGMRTAMEAIEMTITHKNNGRLYSSPWGAEYVLGERTWELVATGTLLKIWPDAWESAREKPTEALPPMSPLLEESRE